MNLPRQPFSKCHGYIRAKEITIREDAPEDLRFAFLKTTREIAHAHLGLYPEKDIRDVVDAAFEKRPDTAWYYQEAWQQVELVVYECEWFRVYDLMESVSAYFETTNPQAAAKFAERLNELFVEKGVGWQLLNGAIVTRGDEAFESTIEIAVHELAERPTTRSRIQEAIGDLSRRPKPDLSGAVSHAFAAMEAIIGDIEYTPEEIRENTRHTFGAFLKRHPDLFLSEDFKEGFQGIWKYANNEGSRHGKEGIEPERDEAELIVSLAAALVTYLNRKHPK